MAVLSSVNWKVTWRLSIVNNEQNGYVADMLDDNNLKYSRRLILTGVSFRYLHE